jgi:putative transcriptional regulator
MDEILPGSLLIADPFLKDPNFSRSAIIICEHQESGSFGFVLNKEYPQELSELVNDLDNAKFPVYYGGPVQKDTLHFLHQCPHLISGGFEVTDGIYWGGEFGDVIELVNQQRLSEKDIRFFLGYSGWSEGQLEGEMKHKSWIVTLASKTLVFRKDIDNTWKDALKQLGGEYKQMINYPLDPQLN